MKMEKMKRRYETPLTTTWDSSMESCLLADSTGLNFEEPGTGEIPVNPGEGHDPGEAFSKTSVWDE